MPTALLLFNPKAGRFAADRMVEQAAGILREKDWEVHTHASRDAADMAVVARAAAGDRLDALIVAGGDGSLGPAVAGLVGSETALGILPTGTRNVFARQLGFRMLRPNDPTGLATHVESLRTATVRCVDVGQANDLPFLLWAGIGLDAVVVAQAERRRSRLKKKFAGPEYFLRALRNAHNFPGFFCMVQGRGIGGETLKFSGRAQIALATNIPLYAGGLLEISPDARMDDEEMDLWLLQGKGTRRALGHVWRILRAAHTESPDSSRLQFNAATLHLEPPACFHTDGEPHGPVSEIKLGILPKALRILVPASARLKILST